MPVIDRFVDELLAAAPEVPSLGIAVVQNGRTVYLREAKTGYCIASTTKAYTGLACAILSALVAAGRAAVGTGRLPARGLSAEPAAYSSMRLAA